MWGVRIFEARPAFRRGTSRGHKCGLLADGTYLMSKTVMESNSRVTTLSDEWYLSAPKKLDGWASGRLMAACDVAVAMEIHWPLGKLLLYVYYSEAT